jgi:glycosyltransferase involved in cell wall biosynthesis
LLWLLSFFGKRWLSDRIVVDAFISLYDTIILDRKLYSATSLLARLLWRIERRAYRFADLVIVDTAESASHLAELFSLPPALFCACPLSTDETVLQPQPYPVLSPAGNNTSNGKCRILFIGTMIPLHGIDTIVACARLLEDDPLTITVIGNGQQGASVSAAGGNIHWLREWVDSPGIAQVIAEADVCLGIFGATDKADRVLPYKIYAYSRVGRAVITAATSCLTNLTRELDYSPFILVPVADAEALAEAIRELASRPQLRAQYAAASARFYAENLSNQALQAKLLGALAGV